MDGILKQHRNKPKELSKQEQKELDEKAQKLKMELEASGFTEPPPKYKTSG